MKELDQKFNQPRFLSWPVYWSIILVTVLFASFMLWLLFSLGETLFKATAIQGAGITADLIGEVRKFYASEVIKVASAHGVKVAPRLQEQEQEQEQEQSIPLPITFALELGRRLNITRPGAEIRVYSNYPFPWRKDKGPQDDFERQALETLTRDPQNPFYSFENVNGRPTIRFAKADLMNSQCVSCHNSTPESPKKDWKVGDVRGVVEFIRPLDDIGAKVFSSKQSLIRSFGITVLITSLGIIGLAIVLFFVRRQARSLAESSQRINSIINTSADGIVSFKENGDLESVNPQAQTIFFYTASEMIGQHVSMLFPSDTAESLREYLETGQSKLFGNRTSEVLGRRKDGATFPIEISLSTAVFDGHRIFTGFVRDISDRKSMEQELLQGQKLQSVGQLAAGIAHEINTPVQYVGDNLQFLQDSFSALTPVFSGFDKLLNTTKTGTIGPELAGEIDIVVQNAQLDYLRSEIPKAISQSLEGLGRVTKIVRAMKEFSHPGVAEKVSADLNEMIESTILVSTSEWKYVAEIETKLDPTIPRIPCYVGEMNQTLLNIIVNAAHAIAEKQGAGAKDKGTITVSTRLNGCFVEIRVQDTGGGIPEAIRSRVFDPFFTTKGVGKGTGQGLAIARSVVVDKHGGTLTFETETGIGTVFVIRLPT